MQNLSNTMSKKVWPYKWNESVEISMLMYGLLKTLKNAKVSDFNYRNKALTAKLLRQGFHYHKLRKTFF